MMREQSLPVRVNGRFLVQPFSGVQRFATELTAAMIRTGQIDEIVLPRGELIDDALLCDVPARRVGGRTGHAWEQFDLPRHTGQGVLLNLGNTAPVLRRKQIVVIHDCGWASTPDAYARSFRMTYRTIQTVLAHNGTRIVTVSEFARGEIARHLRVDPQRIAVVPESGNHMRDHVVADPSVLAASELTPGKYVLAVGNLAAHKNLRVLGGLAKTLAARGVVLAIVGASRDGIFQTQTSSELPQPARYLGRVSDGALRSLYENAACFVFPSRYEGFGLPAAEAMSLGCPVVASDIASLREVCADAALYCDPVSPATFVAQVSAVLDHPRLAEHMVQAAAPQSAIYRWDAAAAAMGAIIRDMSRATARSPITKTRVGAHGEPKDQRP